jgi:hypothetical protein
LTFKPCGAWAAATAIEKEKSAERSKHAMAAGEAKGKIRLQDAWAKIA